MDFGFHIAFETSGFVSIIWDQIADVSARFLVYWFFALPSRPLKADKVE